MAALTYQSSLPPQPLVSGDAVNAVDVTADVVLQAMSVFDQALETAFDQALETTGNSGLDPEKTKSAMNAAIRAMSRRLQEKQRRINGEGVTTRDAPLDAPCWAIVACCLVTLAHNLLPDSLKKGTDWNWMLQVAYMLAIIVTLGVFWRKYLVAERVRYSVRCSTPWFILFWALVLWGMSLYVTEPGFETSARISGTNLLLFYCFFLSLDACACPRALHVFVFVFTFLAMTSALYFSVFAWADYTILDGEPSLHHNGSQVGEVTLNDIRGNCYSNLLSLSLPALVSVIRDWRHQECYLLNRTLFKADVGADLSVPASKKRGHLMSSVM